MQKILLSKISIVEMKEIIHFGEPIQYSPHKKEEPSEQKIIFKDSTTPVSAASGGYLARPSNIYAESKAEVSTSKPSAEEPVSQPTSHNKSEEEALR